MTTSAYIDLHPALRSAMEKWLMPAIIIDADTVTTAINEFNRVHARGAAELPAAEYDRVYEALARVIDGDIRTPEDALMIIGAVIARGKASDGILEPEDLRALEKVRAFFMDQYNNKVSS